MKHDFEITHTMATRTLEGSAPHSYWGLMHREAEGVCRRCGVRVCVSSDGMTDGLAEEELRKVFRQTNCKPRGFWRRLCFWAGE